MTALTRIPFADLHRWVWEKDLDETCKFRRITIPITAQVQPGKGSNGGAHMQLKLSAADWLRRLGVNDIEMERAYSVGINDVLSRGRAVMIECGWTDPRRMIEAAAGGVAAVWLPYAFMGSFQPGDTAEAILCLNPRIRRGVPSRAAADWRSSVKPGNWASAHAVGDSFL